MGGRRTALVLNGALHAGTMTTQKSQGQGVRTPITDWVDLKSHPNVEVPENRLPVYTFLLVNISRSSKETYRSGDCRRPTLGSLQELEMGVVFVEHLCLMSLKIHEFRSVNIPGQEASFPEGNC